MSFCAFSGKFVVWKESETLATQQRGKTQTDALNNLTQGDLFCMQRLAQQCRPKMLLKSGRGKKSSSFHASQSYAVQKEMSFLVEPRSAFR